MVQVDSVSSISGNIFDINNVNNKTDEQKARYVAEQFSALMVNEWVKTARSNDVFDSNLLSSNQVDTAQEWADQQMATDIAKQPGFELTEAILKQIMVTSSFSE